MNIKEEEKYNTVLLLLNIAKNEKHREKAPAINSGRVGAGECAPPRSVNQFA